MGLSLKQIGSHIAEAGSVATLTTALTYVIGRLGAHIFSVVPTASIAASTVLVSRFSDSYFPDISKNELDENNENKKETVQSRWKQRVVCTFAIALGISSLAAKFVLKQPLFDIKGVLILSALITTVKYACQALYDKFAEIRENRKISQNEKNLQEAKETIEKQKDFLLNLNEDNVDTLTTDTIPKIHLENIKHIPSEIFSKLSDAQSKAFTEEQLKELDQNQNQNGNPYPECLEWRKKLIEKDYDL